jgi:transcriptional regulator with XRE-family HTH domain
MMMQTPLTALRIARLRTGIPQYLIAKRARLCASRLSALERGYDAPSARERAALAAVLGIPELELFPIDTGAASTAPAIPGAHSSVPSVTSAHAH